MSTNHYNDDIREIFISEDEFSDYDDIIEMEMKSFGNFYSINQQIIPPKECIKIEYQKNGKNIKLEDNQIIILKSGFYVINFNAQFNQPGQIGLFINDNIDETNIISFNNAGNVSFHNIIFLNRNDKISIKNWISYGDLITSIPNYGHLTKSKNIELIIYQINDPVSDSSSSCSSSNEYKHNDHDSTSISES
jgi:hypothetical protein